jgi:glycosyl transferase family 87
MTTEVPARLGPSGIVRAVASSPISVWAAFVLAHLWLGLVNLYGEGLPLGDVTIVYRFWMDQAMQGTWVGIDTAWVYPIVALVPMLVSLLFGADQYASTWLSMVMILNAVAFGFVTGWGRSRERVVLGWWWIGFLLLLGPIALGRIDSVTVPVAMVGVLVLATRPRAAAVLLTIATWIKIWPAAIVLAAVIALRQRWRIVAVAAIVSAGIVAIALLLGAGQNVVSFITQQTGRGLQIESPVSTIWLWRAFSGELGTYVYYDQAILTYQVEGAGTEAAASVMTPLLLVVVAVIALLGVRALRSGAAPADLLPPLALAFVTAFIAVNKVGSPQFVSWLAVPIVLGIATRIAGTGRSFSTPAAIVLAIAGLTQLVYPYLYLELLQLDPLMLIVLTARNLLYFVLLGWAVHAVVIAPRAIEHDDDAVWLPSVWPLSQRGS